MLGPLALIQSLKAKDGLCTASLTLQPQPAKMRSDAKGTGTTTPTPGIAAFHCQ